MSRLVKEVLIYNFFGVLNTGLPFLLFPILSNYMNASEIGMISLFTTTLGIISIIVGFNAHYPISIKFFKKGAGVINAYITSGFIVSIFISSLFVFAVFILEDKLSVYINLSHNLLYLIIFLSLMQSFSSITLTLLQVQQRIYFYNLTLLVSTLTNCTLSFILVVYGGFGWEGRLIAIALGIILSTFAGLYALVLFQQNVKTSKFFSIPPVPILKDTIKVGKSMFFFSVSGLVISFVDRYVIALYCDFASLGIYAIAYSFGMLPSIFATTLNRAWYPHFIKFLSNKSQYQSHLRKYMLLIVFSIIMVGILVVAAAPWVFSALIGASFSSAIDLIPWLTFAYIFEGITTVFSGAFLNANKGYLMSRFVLFTAVINIVLTFYLVVEEGVIGAAKAMLFTYLFMFAMYFIFCPNFLGLPAIGSFMKKSKGLIT